MQPFLEAVRRFIANNYTGIEKIVLDFINERIEEYCSWYPKYLDKGTTRGMELRATFLTEKLIDGGGFKFIAKLDTDIDARNWLYTAIAQHNNAIFRQANPHIFRITEDIKRLLKEYPRVFMLTGDKFFINRSTIRLLPGYHPGNFANHTFSTQEKVNERLTKCFAAMIETLNVKPIINYRDFVKHILVTLGITTTNDIPLYDDTAYEGEVEDEENGFLGDDEESPNEDGSEPENDEISSSLHNIEILDRKEYDVLLDKLLMLLSDRRVLTLLLRIKYNLEDKVDEQGELLLNSKGNPVSYTKADIITIIIDKIRISKASAYENWEAVDKILFNFKNNNELSDHEFGSFLKYVLTWGKGINII